MVEPHNPLKGVTIKHEKISPYFILDFDVPRYVFRVEEGIKYVVGTDPTCVKSLKDFFKTINDFQQLKMLMTTVLLTPRNALLYSVLDMNT